MKQVRFHPAALRELRHEVRYYGAVSRHLGARFTDAVEQAIGIAARFPDLGAIGKYGTRRVYPKKFPHSNVYLESADEIFVLALAPHRRRPGYWRSRLGDV